MSLKAQKAAEKSALKAARTAQKSAIKAAKTAQKAALKAQPSPLKLKAPVKHGPTPPLAQEPVMAPMAGHSAHRAGQNGVRRDPAPSRMAYRLQRLWLTPLFRAFARVGVPVFGVVLGLGLWLGDDGRRAEVIGQYQDVVRQIQERPEFMVSLLKVEGASPEVDSAIRAMMPVKLPASSFQIDLDALHEVITRLDAVAEAKLVIRGDGVLEVSVAERQPAILWRHATGIEMLDADGQRVATLLDRAARPDLPLIAGEGAASVVPEALDILAASGPILSRARGLVRVGERRWDIILDRGQKIMLPQENPVLAIERLLAIDAAEDLMGRDFTHLDLRNQDRPTIRLSEAALTEFRAIKGFETKVSK
jgi:cell division protein FtsQ